MAELRLIFDKKEFLEFVKWHEGQTGVVDGNGEFIVYAHDVQRYVDMKKLGIPTYFD